MSILFSDEIKTNIINEISKTSQFIQIISAFCKLNGIDFIEKCIQKPLQNKRLMARFLLDDIVSGASDLEVYEFCKANGWQMYVRFDLHAKTYVFDRKRCLLGSANLTSKGIGLVDKANYELASLVDIDELDYKRIESLFDQALLMTDSIYKLMCDEYNIIDKCASKTYTWSSKILDHFTPKNSVLFTYDFPNTVSPLMINEGDLDFLNLPITSSLCEIQQAFKWSKVYVWLRSAIEEAENNCIYFGEATEKLHNIMVNDPKPYRKEVKVLLQNLLNWIEELNISDIIIDRPSYSQRMRLIKPQ